MGDDSRGSGNVRDTCNAASTRGLVLKSDWEALAHHFGDQLVDLWHDSNDPACPASLAEWMGLTDTQYAAWAEGRYGEVLP